MSNEERLRKALQSVKYRLQYSDHTKASRELADIVDYIDHKLRSIDRRPEMDRLVEWLEQDEGDYVSSEMQFTVIRVSRLFDHIREMKEQP